MSILRNTINLGHHLLDPYIKEGITAVDCTLGNGNDTAFLLKKGVRNIFAFDIQKEAIESSKKLLHELYPNQISKIKFILDGHENIDKYVEKVNLAIFNLGYLPRGDKSLSTKPSTSILAISKVLHILDKNGVCLITMYDGHDDGKEEKRKILDFAEKLDSLMFHVVYLSMINQQKNPPEILVINKK